MSSNIPIIYSGFHDAPLAFVAWHKGLQFLFLREFDDVLDDYPDTYRVSLLPGLSDDAVKDGWEHLEHLATRYVGEVPVSSIVFDSTRRREINTPVLDTLLVASSPALEMAGI